MRIISQDGTIDTPYELSMIWIREKYGHSVMAGMPNDEPISLGTYSSREKALKAMEMLRNTYTAKEWKPSVVNKNGEVLEEMQFFDEKRYFQFPKDDEVEV